MNFSPDLLDELARVFAEAAVDRLFAEAAKDDGDVASTTQIIQAQPLKTLPCFTSAVEQTNEYPNK